MLSRKKSYADAYRDINFRDHPDKYLIGRGEQGVLMAEPYKSEILPYWKFATTKKAEASANKILDMFYDYKNQNDFVGMDMARKFLQMGYTRSRRTLIIKVAKSMRDQCRQIKRVKAEHTVAENCRDQTKIQ